MRHSGLLFALLLQACDPKAPPASPSSGPAKPSMPPPGVLRLVQSGKTAVEILSDRKPAVSLPSIAFRMEYAGPSGIDGGGTFVPGAEQSIIFRSLR